MKLAVEGVVEADVGLDVDVVEVEVDLTGIQSTMKTLLETTMDFLEDTGHLKREIQENPLKSVSIVDLVVASVGVGVVSAMKRMQMGNVLEGHMNVAVVLDVGMSLSEKGLVVGIGGPPLMILLRKLKSLSLKVKRMLVLRSSWERRKLWMLTRRVL
jgi:hypothetical protein